MTGGPPEVIPTVRTPPRAVQQVTMLKLKPTMPRREKERFGSVGETVLNTQCIHPQVLQTHHGRESNCVRNGPGSPFS